MCFGKPFSTGNPAEEVQDKCRLKADFHQELGRGGLCKATFRIRALGSPACCQAQYTCAWDVPYGILAYSFVVMVGQLLEPSISFLLSLL